MPNHKRDPLPQWACDLYTQGMSPKELGEILGVSISTARASLIASGVKMRKPSESMALSSFKWGSHMVGRKLGSPSAETRAKISAANFGRGKGTRTKHTGYEVVTRHGPNQHRGVHDLVVEAIIGRRLEKHEVVHHKDQNRKNNDPSNLQLMTRSEHQKLHMKLRHEP